MTGAMVGIVVGSDSDLPVMKEAAEVLEELGIGCEVVISSAHRTPEQTAHYARTAAERGLAVIIAAAGMAAHLPGVIAAHTPLPVIGVPVKSGALLAAQIIGAGDPAVRERVARYKARMAEAVLGKARRLAEVGLDAYLKEMGEKGK